MTLFNLSWKFFTRRANSNKINFSSFLPIVGVAIGTLTIILTFAIMDGLERDIFGSLKNFSGATIIKTNKIDNSDYNKIENYLINENIKYSKFIERKAILQFGKENRILNVRAFSNLKIALDGINQNNQVYNENTILVGEELSNRLNISYLDSINLISPLDLKFSSTIIPQENLIVNDIYSTRLLDFDLNYVYIPFSIGEKLFNKSGNTGFYIKEKLNIPESISQIINIKIYHWDEIHGSLVEAMKLEKIAYVSFGFLLILISGFSLLSTMSISVIQKISQIGILKTIGYNNRSIKLIFFYFSIISGIIGSIIGVSISYIVKSIETNYPFFHYIFGNYPFLNFPLDFDEKKIILMSLLSICAIILASILPAIRAAKLNPVHSIGIK